MEFCHFDIAGPVLLKPRRIEDGRGYFQEVFRSGTFRETIDSCDFVQENESFSTQAGTIRGLHFQTTPFAQGKLVRCVTGAIFDVAVDLRHESPDFGRWVGVILTSQNGEQLWIPPGFGHGFCSLEPSTTVCYKVTAYYSADHDAGVAWDDADIGIAWPEIANPTYLSDKDRRQPTLRDLPSLFPIAG